MKTIQLILSACFTLVASVHSQENRIWTYAKTGSTCEGALLWKSPDGTELQIKRKDNGHVITLKAELLTAEDQKQINAWQAPAPPAFETTTQNADLASVPPDGSLQAAIQKKLDTLIIPRIDFQETTLFEAIDFFRLRGSELDVAEVDSNKKGFNLVISQSPPSNPPRLNLKLENVPIGTALKNIADQVGMKIKINEYFVELKPDGAAETLEPKKLSESAPVAATQKKLDTIVIPRIDFEDTTIEEAIDFLRLRCYELDEAEIVKSQKGINFVITRPPQFNPPRLKALRVRNVPAGTLINYIAGQVGMKVRIKEYFVELMPIGAADIPELRSTMSEVAGAAAKIIIPRTDFENCRLDEAVTFFNARIKELAQGKNAPVIILDAKADSGATIRELRMRNAPLLALISYIASTTSHQVISEGNTLRITKQ